MFKILIIGSGFVGQATGKGLLAQGHTVTFTDINHATIDQLRAAGYAAYTVDEVAPHDDSDISILAVNTPTTKGKINLSYLQQAAIALGERLAKRSAYHLVVVRSTVVPGTSEAVAAIIARHSGKKLGRDFGLCMNPEYLRQKSAEEDFAHPWLIVVGQHDQRSGDTLAELYKDFTCPVHRVSLREAELQKYVHNLFNAVKITFFNEMRAIARQAGIDPERIFGLTTQSAEGMWNPVYGTRDFGPFDGSCLPKDTQAFLHWVESRGASAPLLASAIAVNRALEADHAAVAVLEEAPTTPAPAVALTLPVQF